MITIIINNAKCKVNAPLEILAEIRKNFSIKAKNYFWAAAWRSRQWDGFINYITPSGYFAIGLLPGVLDFIKENKWDLSVEDNRITLKLSEAKVSYGDMELRKYQAQALKTLIQNKVLNLPFNNGIFDHATNSGKTILAAGIYLSLPKHATLIFIVNRLHLYKQALDEIPKMINEKPGFIGPDGVKWARFMICSQQSVIAKYSQVSVGISKFTACIIDECHYAASKSYKKILGTLVNCSLRVGMSGTALKHKDKNKNMLIQSFFGPQLHSITNKELVTMGFSTKPVIRIWHGNTEVKIPGDYAEEDKLGIQRNKLRNKKIINLAKAHLKKGRVPILIIARYQKHVERLYRLVKKHIPEVTSNYLHVNVKDRFDILEDFKVGKLQILVSSQLIKDGKNLPLIQSIILAGGGDSEIVVLQILGRGLRKHDSKQKVYIDDFKDIGAYLSRHSKHRIKYFKDQGFKVKDMILLKNK